MDYVTRKKIKCVKIYPKTNSTPNEMQIGEEKSFTIPQEVNANLLATETSGTLSNVHAGSFAAHRNGYKIKISKFVNK